MEVEELILLNEENWKRMEEKSKGIFFHEKLLIGEDTITVKFEIGEKKNFYGVYINGVIKGAETEENGKKYWSEKRKMLTKSDIEAYKIMAKRTTSEENRKEYLEKIKSKVRFSWYSPCFSSFKSFMREYKKRHKEIYWITGGSE